MQGVFAIKASITADEGPSNTRTAQHIAQLRPTLVNLTNHVPRKHVIAGLLAGGIWVDVN